VLYTNRDKQTNGGQNITPANLRWEVKFNNIDFYHTHTTPLLHPFNGLFSRTTWVSRHQKGKPFWILLEQEMMGWQ